MERGLVEHVQQHHLHLCGCVLVDLKMKSFEPEFAGKMTFSFSVTDDPLRHQHDAPTIGLLLCKDTKKNLKVGYALRDVKKPIGVAEWQTRLVDSLPKKRHGALPTIAEIEHEPHKPRRPRARATT